MKKRGSYIAALSLAVLLIVGCSKDDPANSIMVDSTASYVFGANCQVEIPFTVSPKDLDASKVTADYSGNIQFTTSDPNFIADLLIPKVIAAKKSLAAEGKWVAELALFTSKGARFVPDPAYSYNLTVGVVLTLGNSTSSNVNVSYNK